MAAIELDIGKISLEGDMRSSRAFAKAEKYAIAKSSISAFALYDLRWMIKDTTSWEGVCAGKKLLDNES